MNRPLDRRQFLKVTTGALAVGVTACSSEGGDGAAVTVGRL